MTLKYFFSFSLSVLFSISIFSQTRMDQKNGIVITKYDNGNIESKGNVSSHYKTGTWNYYYPDGKLQKLEIYYGGILFVSVTEYYENGNMKSSKNYNGDEEQYGAQTFWWENGNLKLYYFIADDGSKKTYTYNENGKIQTIETQKNNLPNGSRIIYASFTDPNARDTFPVTIENYTNGKLEGFVKNYSDGKIYKEQHYRNNLLDSATTTWYANGDLESVEMYSYGLQNGKTTYYSQGKPYYEANYSKGLMNGKETRWLDDRPNYSWYTNDELDSSIDYYSDGSIRLKYSMVAPSPKLLHAVEYDSTGKMSGDWFYKDGKMNGNKNCYYRNGKLKSSVMFVDDNPVGQVKAWNANGKLVLQAELNEKNETSSPPQIWNDAGAKLSPGTKLYGDQLKNNIPGELSVNKNNPTQIGYYEEEPPPPPMEELTDTMYTVAQVGEVQEGEVMDPPPVFTDPSSIAKQDTDIIYTLVEVMPDFPGGLDGLKKYLIENIKYPSQKDAEGTVYVQFVVEKDGAITNVVSVKDVSGAPEFTTEAIRVVSSMPNWSPGKMNGKPVRVQCVQPIRFARN